jgi:hypothetical protein
MRGGEMSGLVPMALRMAVVQLLRDRTAAGSRVTDSPVDPIHYFLDGLEPGGAGQAPLIAVFIESATRDCKGRDLSGVECSVNLVIWVYLPPTVVEVEDGLVLDSRSEGAATALDLISTQVRKALLFGPALWRKVYDAIVLKVDRSISRPVLVENEQGVKIMALETVLTLNVVPEPEFGRSIRGELWPSFDAAALATPDIAPLAGLIKSMIEGPEGLSDWRQIQGALGQNYAEMRAMGLVPFDATETEGEAAVLEQISTSGGNVIVPPGI